MKMDFLLIMTESNLTLFHTRHSASTIFTMIPSDHQDGVQEFIEVSNPGDYFADENRSYVIVRVSK